MPRPFGWRLDNFRTTSADDAMQLTVFAPRAGATCLVDGLAEMRTDAGITRTLVAESRLSLGVRIAGAAHRWQGDGWHPLPLYTLTGVHCTSRTIRTDPGSTLVLVHLHPAAARLLGVDPTRLVERSIDLTTVWPRTELEKLSCHLRRLPDGAERATCFEAFVVQRMNLHDREPDPSMVEAVNRIRAARGDVRISEIATVLGLSVDTLERRFYACVGVSPKRFARAVRLRAAVLAYSPRVTLTEVAIEAGYYDQSHFVREIRLATGQAPNRLLGSQNWC